MAPSCSICTSQARDDINRDILGGSSIRDVASRYGVHRSSVDRHRRRCLRAAVTEAMARDVEVSAARMQSIAAGLLEETAAGVLRVKLAISADPDDRSLWSEHRAAVDAARKCAETLARFGGVGGPDVRVEVDARRVDAVFASLSEDELRALVRGDVVDGETVEVPALPASAPRS